MATKQQAPAQDTPDTGAVATPADAQPEAAVQQEKAADVIRHQLYQIYEHAPPNKVEEETPASGTYDHTYNETPVDWQHYHSAWQTYYQQYYRNYYLQQLNAERERMKGTHAQPTVEKFETVNQQDAKAEAQPEEPVTKTSAIRNRLLAIALERAKKVRASHHFLPIASALAVGAIFLFLQYNRFLIAGVEAYVTPASSVVATEALPVDPTLNLNVGPEPKIIIPKINVNAKVDYSITSLSENAIQSGLRDGVVHYNLPGASSLPGQVGNTVLLGHSSNDIFDPGDSKFVFVLLDHLEPGDIFYIHYQGTRYIYKVDQKKIILPTDIAALQINNGKPMATLITCTPLGTDLKRLLIIGEQISPDPAKAAQAAPTTSNEPSAIPGNSPTLLDKIYDFFF